MWPPLLLPTLLCAFVSEYLVYKFGGFVSFALSTLKIQTLFKAEFSIKITLGTLGNFDNVMCGQS